MIARIVSRIFLKKQYEPELKLEKGYYFSFWQFLGKSTSNNFGKFTIFRALLAFAASIAGPFFAVYMLRTLEFSYATFMIVVFSQTLFSILTVRAWGKFADKYGNYEVMKITAVLVPLYPILWLISESPIFLVFGPSLVGGIAWSGFNLAAGNFIFDSVTPQKRGLAVSYYNLLHGVGIFLGATLGAILVKYLSISFMDILLFIFLISAFARMTVSLIMLPRFKEIRETKAFDSSKAIKHLIPRHFKIPLAGEFHDLVIKRKIKWKK
jgi:MFS family permease